MAVLLSLLGSKNTAFVTYVALESQAAATIMQVNPTLAAGDAKVSVDGGALANLATLPAVTPAGSKMVKVSLSAAEMNGDDITVVLSDAAGAEWQDVVLSIRCNATITMKQLAITNPTGHAVVLVSSGNNGSGLHATAHGSGHGIYCSGALDGAGSGLHARGGTDGISTMGYGVGAGIATQGGSANGSTFPASNGAGLLAQANGKGAGVQLVGGADAGAAAGSGYGLLIDGGTLGGVLIRPGAGSLQPGLWILGDTTGAGSSGVWIQGGGAAAALRVDAGATGVGFKIAGGTASGDGLRITTTDGNGISVAPSGTSRHAMLLTGASLGTSDGLKAVAGAAGGVDIRGNITGNLSGSIGSVATGAIVAASFGAAAIDAAAIATDAFGALELAAGAAGEIATAILTTAMTEAYSTKNGSVTLAQAVHELLSYNQERAIAGPVMTAFKRDGITPAMTMTLDNATAPRTVSRAT